MKKISKRFMLTTIYASMLTLSAEVHALNGFVVRDIKITGLQRVSKGTVLNYLPVQIGEEIDQNSTAKIIRALYDTGFFQSVVLERKGNTLVVRVVERSTIGSVSVVGNNEIPSDKMKEILKELGLVKGLVFQRAALERLQKELKQAYNARGKYNARITAKVTTLTENRVAISVTVSEGRVSRIKDIKIIGNHAFSSSELRHQLALSSSNIFTYFSKKDQYSKSAMDASLESLRSFYLDHGYLKFKIISSQVLLAPDRKDVFINIHIEDGPQYTFSGYDLVGKMVIPKAKLCELVEVIKGEVFSRKKITQTIKAIGLALGDIGYGFPAVNAEPQVNEKDKTVFINFVIDPGRHVYVRRINFHGNTKTADYVLRNVILQNEGSLLSLHNIKESERQLRMISYIKDVNVKTIPIPGANNQVDLDISVEEAPSAEASASLGYGTTGPQVNAAFNQYNFMGTGRTVGLGFNASLWGQDYSFNYYNPFYTKTGIGRGVNMYFQTVNPSRLDVSAYNSNRYGGDVNYNVHLGEAHSIQVGYGYQGIKVQSVGAVQQIQNFVNLNGREFNEIRLTGGISRNTYDQMPYPKSGVNQQAAFLFALPASSKSLNYYKASYQAKMYQPVYKEFIFTALGSFGFGNSYNGQGLPFYENYFAGGIAQPGQVRGYESYSLGPVDSTGRSIGANLLVSGMAGMILPYPLSRENFRSTLFIDGGNVFVKDTPAALTGTNSGPLRFSGGVSFDWRSPFGPLSFSMAAPINKQPLDQAQYFQFTMSSGF
ncbi:MAG: outer membrane protein assembly factor BamA [Legionellales bacterium RIFCSPHIGHO2_12_FULL_35_11]|nr:MAG: outer membrane protein assembly factor BamA [Legionellales bacterium RIFCSPHIGHO2_12_FULL_35_11]